MAGRGKTTSFTQEQLQSLGVGKDLPVQTAPPPTYPPLISKPVKQETTAALNYLILWKEDFLNHMRDSPYFLTPKIKSSTNRFSEEWMESAESSKAKPKPDYNWSYMPAELSLRTRKRPVGEQRNSKTTNAKRAKTGDINDHLKLLEEKERKDDGRDKGNSDSDRDDEEEEEAIAADEEMDDENDYGNSYFDNGEAYNEEDDNLDDGPVY